MFKKVSVFFSGIILIASVHVNAAYIPNSELLTQDYANKLENWLGDSFNADVFNLVYRGSDNGFAAATFHSMVNNVTGTLTIIRDVNGNLFGGYNTGAWSATTGYQSNSGGFLFNLLADRVLKPIAGREQYGFYNNAAFGPIFGSDLVVSSNANSVATNYMQLTNYSDGKTTLNLLGGSIKTYFEVADIEVLSVRDAPVSVPEPSSILLLGFGLAGFVGFAGFKRLFRKS